MATPRKRVIPRVQGAGPDLTPHVEEYLLNRSLRERASYHEGRLKKSLMDIIEVAGVPVEKRKKLLELEAPLPYVEYKNGKPIQKKITGIERRERVTESLDEDLTLKLLFRKGLVAECTTTIVVVDEDAVLAANYEGKITDKELAALYSETITPAFYLIEETS